jgi:hypothetical protein
VTVEQYWMGKNLDLEHLGDDFDRGSGYIQERLSLPSVIFCVSLLDGTLRRYRYLTQIRRRTVPLNELCDAKLMKSNDGFGAGYRIRTCDPLITNQVHYQLC